MRNYVDFAALSSPGKFACSARRLEVAATQGYWASVSAEIEREPEPLSESEPKVDEKLAVAHGLKPDEYARLVKLIGRTPTFTELGIVSAMWNEHCSYKSSSPIRARRPELAAFCAMFSPWAQGPSPPSISCASARPIIPRPGAWWRAS